MKIATAWSVDSKGEKAAEAAYSTLMDRLQTPPDLILVHSSCLYDNAAVLKKLRLLAPGVPVQGGTSCFGVMTEDGYHSRDGKGLGLFAISDPEGAYGCGISPFGDDPRAATREALGQAIQNAGRAGESPAAVIVSPAPGGEERIIEAVAEFLGPHTPIIGGTTADNDMSGQWKQFAGENVEKNGVSIAVLYPTGDIGYAFHSGYEPTSHTGRVTRAAGRTLYEIDGRPAARVYDEWTGGLITGLLPHGGSMVPSASFTPLGRAVSRIGGVSFFQLSYPAEALPGEALLVFAEIKEGDEVVLMHGNRDSLVSRAGRVAAVALDAAPFPSEEIQGALALFCTGCMLVVQDRLADIAVNLRESLRNAPFLSAFTLGEQGCFLDGGNRHGNLMIAALVFGPATE